MRRTELTRDAQGERFLAPHQTLGEIARLSQSKYFGEAKVIEAMMPIHQLLLDRA